MKATTPTKPLFVYAHQPHRSPREICLELNRYAQQLQHHLRRWYDDQDCAVPRECTSDETNHAQSATKEGSVSVITVASSSSKAADTTASQPQTTARSTKCELRARLMERKRSHIPPSCMWLRPPKPGIRRHLSKNVVAAAAAASLEAHHLHPPHSHPCQCEHCGALFTSTWRRGPARILLCNRCGLRYSKAKNATRSMHIGFILN